MSIHVTSFNGMGEVTETPPGVFNTFGMKVEDHMHISGDLITNAGIAKILDLSVKAVEKRMSLALKTLKNDS